MRRVKYCVNQYEELSMNIKKIDFYRNRNDISLETEKLLISKLEASGFEIDNEKPDLIIAIGGDGAFLRCVKSTSFNPIINFIGVNTGTLGFLQEVKVSEIDEFINKLKNNHFSIEKISVLETTITTESEEVKILSLNEILFRNGDLKTCKLDISIDNELLENYVGDGILISTTIGSTAYNLSMGGSIVFSGIHTLQLTPIAPLNTKAYRDIMNSIIMSEEKEITIIPANDKKDLITYSDGDIKTYRKIKEIKVKISNQKINCIRLNNYSYTKIINEKFLK
jgi:NAD+ kinase